MKKYIISFYRDQHAAWLQITFNESSNVNSTFPHRSERLNLKDARFLLLSCTFSLFKHSKIAQYFLLLSHKSIRNMLATFVRFYTCFWTDKDALELVRFLPPGRRMVTSQKMACHLRVRCVNACRDLPAAMHEWMQTRW